MIWAISISLFFNVAVLVLVYVMGRAILDELRELPGTFPPVPDCKFKESKSQCLYSPGSEPERICALREEDKKNQGQKIPQVIPAPRWSDRSPPGEE